MRIDRLHPVQLDEVEGDLADLLVAVVADGASIGFLAPLDPADARAWWRGALQAPGTRSWVCRDDVGDLDRPGRVVGVVQLRPVDKANGGHRADVSKLMVLPTARGRGIAGLLMDRLEAEAQALGRWLLVLDTRTGSHAETLYRRWGWEQVGTIEDFARDPDGALAPTTIFVKRLT